MNVGLPLRKMMAISAEKKGDTLRIAELFAAPSRFIETVIIQDPTPSARTPPPPKKANEVFDGLCSLFLDGIIDFLSLLNTRPVSSCSFAPLGNILISLYCSPVDSR